MLALSSTLIFSVSLASPWCPIFFFFCLSPLLSPCLSPIPSFFPISILSSSNVHLSVPPLKPLLKSFLLSPPSISFLYLLCLFFRQLPLRPVITRSSPIYLTSPPISTFLSPRSLLSPVPHFPYFPTSILLLSSLSLPPYPPRFYPGCFSSLSPIITPPPLPPHTSLWPFPRRLGAEGAGWRGDG